MFSIPDIGLLGIIALLVFGPEQLPKIMRQVGRVTREVQSTSQSFIREMERAADVNTYEPPPPDFTTVPEPPEPLEPFEAPAREPDPPPPASRPILPHDL